MKLQKVAFKLDLSRIIIVKIKNDEVGVKITVKGRVGNPCNIPVCHTASYKRTKSNHFELERLALVLSNICKEFSDDLSNVLYQYVN